MKLGKSMHFRMMAINSLLLLLVLCLLGLTYHLTLTRFHQNEIRAYDTALNVLYGVFSEKQTSFPSTLNALYETAGVQHTVNEALRADELSDDTREKLAAIFAKVCAVDYDIVGVLLDSAITGKLYGYSITAPVVSDIETRGVLPTSGQNTRMLLNEAEINALSGGRWRGVYGLTGQLGDAGHIVVMYANAGLDALVTAFGFGNDTEYAILTDRDTLLFGRQTWPEQNVGNAMQNDRYRFTVAYQADDSALTRLIGFLLPMFLVAAAGLLIATTSLYIMFQNASRRQVLMIKNALRKISETDFEHKIPESRMENEYSSIIRSINRMGESLQQNIALRYTYAAQKKSAELYALQTSINPHFLSNMLENVRARIATSRTKEAEVMLILLSKLYRSLIKEDMFASVMDEIDRCSMLLEIYQMRFDNFDCVTSVPDEFMGLGLPRSTLQPIIENYFEHGIDATRAYNQITIRAAWVEVQAQRCMLLSVENDGITPTPEALAALREKLSTTQRYEENQSGGFGLPNVNNRLKIVFGGAYGLRVVVPEAGGFITEVLVPPRKPEELRRDYERLSTREGGM